MALEGSSDGAPLALLFSGPAPLELPRLLSSPWPQINVRAAQYFADGRALRLQVSSVGKATFANATLIVSLGGGSVDKVVVEGGSHLHWSERGDLLEIALSVTGTVAIDVLLH